MVSAIQQCKPNIIIHTSRPFPACLLYSSHSSGHHRAPDWAPVLHSHQLPILHLIYIYADTTFSHRPTLPLPHHVHHCAHYWWDWKLVQLDKNMQEPEKKLKIELPQDPLTSLLSVYPKRTSRISRDNVSTLMFIVTLLQIAKMWKHLKFLLMDDGGEKVVYIQNGILYRL